MRTKLLANIAKTLEDLSTDSAIDEMAESFTPTPHSIAKGQLVEHLRNAKNHLDDPGYVLTASRYLSTLCNRSDKAALFAYCKIDEEQLDTLAKQLRAHTNTIFLPQEHLQRIFSGHEDINVEAQRVVTEYKAEHYDTSNLEDFKTGDGVTVHSNAINIGKEEKDVDFERRVQAELNKKINNNKLSQFIIKSGGQKLHFFAKVIAKEILHLDSAKTLLQNHEDGALLISDTMDSNVQVNWECIKGKWQATISFTIQSHFNLKSKSGIPSAYGLKYHSNKWRLAERDKLHGPTMFADFHLKIQLDHASDDTLTLTPIDCELCPVDASSCQLDYPLPAAAIEEEEEEKDASQDTPTRKKYSGINLSRISIWTDYATRDDRSFSPDDESHETLRVVAS